MQKLPNKNTNTPFPVLDGNVRLAYPFGKPYMITRQGKVFIDDRRGRPRKADDHLWPGDEDSQEKWREAKTHSRPSDGEIMHSVKVGSNVTRRVRVIDLVAAAFFKGFELLDDKYIVVRKEGARPPSCGVEDIEVFNNPLSVAGPHPANHPLLCRMEDAVFKCTAPSRFPYYFPVDPATGDTLRDLRYTKKRDAFFTHHIERVHLGLGSSVLEESRTREAAMYELIKEVEISRHQFEKEGEGIDDVLSA